MEVKEAIKKRKSIRGYKTDPVPKNILEEILTTATRAPSAMNTQPWEIIVLSGGPLEKLRKSNIEGLSSGNMPMPDIAPAGSIEGVYKERQRELGLSLFQLLEITREDKQKKQEWTMKGFRAFDAPAMIILSADENLDTRFASSDIGGLIQTICLVALEYGLGTCINGQGILFPDAVRTIAGIPESQKIYICIAIGYADWDHPANKLVSDRESVETVTRWVGFDQ